MKQEAHHENLEPKIECLKEEYVLIQAWKKTANYIRTHNWFSDTLELDLTTINLPDFLAGLAKEVQTYQDWTSDPLRLVPAPKSQQWLVPKPGVWKPKCESAIPLRPLAHVTLRDQVMATAVMLCLADRVETEQGDPRLSIAKAEGRKKISSYGNRLFCKQRGEMLQHSWGSKKLYRSYFKDYQKFLDRPQTVANSIPREGKRIFIVTAVLSQFYDRVSPKDLAEGLKKLQFSSDEAPFFNLAGKVLNWKWAESDSDFISDYVVINEIPECTFRQVALPQGLAAAGFFANVAMIGFDMKVRNAIGREIEPGFNLEDACRYVDDMRFVVSVDHSHGKDAVTKSIEVWLDNLLRKEAPALKVSKRVYENSSNRCGQAFPPAIDHGHINPGFGGVRPGLVVFAEAAVASQPGESPLHDPALGQHREALGLRVFTHDVQRPGGGFRHPGLQGSGVPAVGPQQAQVGKQARHPLQDQFSSIPVLDIRGVHHHGPQPALRVHYDVAFTPFYLFCRHRTLWDPPARWFSRFDCRSRRHGDRRPARPAGAPTPAMGHAGAPRCHSGAPIGSKGRPWTRPADHAADCARHTPCAARTGSRSRLRAKAHCAGDRPF